MKIIRTAAVLLTALAICFAAVSAWAEGDPAMRDISTAEIVAEMGMGINLGNTFEACGDWIAQWGGKKPEAYETAWGSPVVTEKMIRGYAEAGFGVLRIPVAWSNMMAEDGSYTIDPAYIDRVRQVTDWALDAGMYVIVNLHWDGGWLANLPEAHDAVMEKYTAIWRQVSEAFSGYGDRLLFEAQNEELGWNSVWNQWSHQGDKAQSYAWCNEVNQAFVDIVRQSGDLNAKRHLLISGYNTDIELTCDPLFRMPEDPENRMALSLHYYTPSTFTILEEDADWGKASFTWGSEAEYAELTRNFDLVEKTYTSRGIPVILGEFGCTVKNKDPESARRYLAAVAEECFRRGGICPVLWDTPGSRYDRTACRFTDTALLESFLESRDRSCAE